MAKKLFYKIGEACKILEIQPYVLRYWEKEFPLLSPDKSKSGQRVYSEQELNTIRRIKELLYEEGYTIAGAKKKLEVETSADEESPDKTPKPRKRRASAKKAAPAKKATKSADTPVDNGTAEELERLRSGIQAALVQAKEILGRLEAPSA